MRLIATLLILSVGLSASAQGKNITFQLKDSISKEALIGVSVRIGNKGLKTNSNGVASLELDYGKHDITFSYLGYSAKTIQLNLSKETENLMEVFLTLESKQLQILTISGSRFEKRISEEITSIEVLKPSLLMSRADNSLDDALQRVPGVDVIENQVNIRGGSGWSYGAGSRVLVLVDDMPMLTADAADAKWDFAPLETCEQIEVLKGAASSLYGSSALNGVVNFRTAYAKSKPKTKVMLYNGMYGNPPNKNWVWWDRQQPGFQGGYFSHAQKFQQLDFVLGSAWYSDDSYLQGDLTRRMRVNSNLRYRFKRLEGLTVGVNFNWQKLKTQTFFFWQPDSVNGDRYLQPFGGLDITTTTINKNRGDRGNVDPYISYITKRGTKHILRTRFFRSKNDIAEKRQSSIADTYFGEYQIQNQIQSKYSLFDSLYVVGGMMASKSKVIGLLYGNHNVVNVAPYIQLEKKWKRLWLNAGVRYEVNGLDTFKVEKRPVIRSGLNYQLNEFTFLRASFGQGYRYPSVAERFIETSFGASRVFKNLELRSERGWSSELGTKIAYKANSWLGYIDIALFWMEYSDMMEFNFGLFPDSNTNLTNINDYFGFKSINVGRSRINGLDISIIGQGKVSNAISSRFIIGLTFMNPVLLNPDSFVLRNVSGTSNTLKYRYRNSFKLDVEASYRKITLGTTCMYNSFMQNVDEAFVATKPDQNPLGGLVFQLGSDLPRSIHAFRQKYYKGNFIWDARIAYHFTPQIKFAFIVRNLLNTIYTERPALIAPLRNFTLQLGFEL